MSPECRICFSPQEFNNPLISPCGCKGTSLYIHVNCVMKWIQVSGKSKCGQCNQEYVLNVLGFNIWFRNDLLAYMLLMTICYFCIISCSHNSLCRVIYTAFIQAMQTESFKLFDNLVVPQTLNISIVMWIVSSYFIDNLNLYLLQLVFCYFNIIILSLYSYKINDYFHYITKRDKLNKITLFL